MSVARFVGAWRLVSFESRRPDGTLTYPFGEAPIGIAIFSPDGHVAAQLMRPDRPPLSSPGPTAEEIRQAFDGCVAYFGACNVDEATHTLVTRVAGSLFPNWIGGDQVRDFEFRGEQLVLRPPPRQTPAGLVTSELVWERALPAPGWQDSAG